MQRVPQQAASVGDFLYPQLKINPPAPDQTSAPI